MARIMRASPEHRQSVFQAIKNHQIDTGVATGLGWIASKTGLPEDTIVACCECLVESKVIVKIGLPDYPVWLLTRADVNSRVVKSGDAHSALSTPALSSAHPVNDPDSPEGHGIDPQCSVPGGGRSDAVPRDCPAAPVSPDVAIGL